MPHRRSPSLLKLWLEAEERASAAEREMVEASMQSKSAGHPPPARQDWQTLDALRAEAARLSKLAAEDAQTHRQQAALARHEASLVRKQAAEVIQDVTARSTAIAPPRPQPGESGSSVRR